MSTYLYKERPREGKSLLELLSDIIILYRVDVDLRDSILYGHKKKCYLLFIKTKVVSLIVDNRVRPSNSLDYQDKYI